MAQYLQLSLAVLCEVFIVKSVEEAIQLYFKFQCYRWAGSVSSSSEGFGHLESFSGVHYAEFCSKLFLHLSFEKFGVLS